MLGVYMGHTSLFKKHNNWVRIGLIVDEDECNPEEGGHPEHKETKQLQLALTGVNVHTNGG
jgi:hypothetical protein